MSSYEPLNRVELSSAGLRHNHQILQKFHPEAKVIPVVKANAYGHGLVEVAKILDQEHPQFLAMNSYEEARKLEENNIQTPRLILGPLPLHGDLELDVSQTEFVVSNEEQVRRIIEIFPEANIHIFVGTGMSREGIPFAQLQELVRFIASESGLRITGLASHFADADNPEDRSFVDTQIGNFRKALSILESEGIRPQWKHISASGGMYKVHDPVFTAIRAGKISYGYSPLDDSDPAYQDLGLHPALRFLSILVVVKNISQGAKVGYGLTFTAPKEMKIGVFPVGYFEGVDRRLSNKGFVKVAGIDCSIIGRVSMNMTTIDLSEVPGAKVGDEVEILSSNPQNKNSVSQAAKLASTICYDILTGIQADIARVVTEPVFQPL